MHDCVQCLYIYIYTQIQNDIDIDIHVYIYIYMYVYVYTSMCVGTQIQPSTKRSDLQNVDVLERSMMPLVAPPGTEWKVVPQGQTPRNELWCSTTGASKQQRETLAEVELENCYSQLLAKRIKTTQKKHPPGLGHLEET